MILLKENIYCHHALVKMVDTIKVTIAVEMVDMFYAQKDSDLSTLAFTCAQAVRMHLSAAFLHLQ